MPSEQEPPDANEDTLTDLTEVDYRNDLLIILKDTAQ